MKFSPREGQTKRVRSDHYRMDHNGSVFLGLCRVVDRRMINEFRYRYLDSLELWLVRNKLVASQQAYTHEFIKETWHEVRHFYCTTCGDVWGQRVNPSLSSPRHYFYKSTCVECGGDENMLTPWELSNTDILGPNVLAYLILQTDPGGLS